MDSLKYQFLCTIHAAEKSTHEQLANEIFEEIAAEFKNHALIDPTDVGEVLLGRLDALIDILYYIFDSCQRLALPAAFFTRFEDDASDSISELEFRLYEKVGVFTRDVMQSYTNTTGEVVEINPDRQLKFVLAMVGSEIFEFENRAIDVVAVLKERYETLSVVPPDGDVMFTSEPWQNLWMMVDIIVRYFETAYPALLEALFDAVHAANLQKGEAPAAQSTAQPNAPRVYKTKLVASGVKAVKPDGWKAPDLRLVWHDWSANV